MINPPIQVDDYDTIAISLAVHGLDKDTDPLDLDKTSPNMKNMVVEKGWLRKRLGATTLGSNLPLSGIGMELSQYTDARGTVHHIAITTTNAYRYELGLAGAGYDIWHNITPSVDLDDCENGWTQGSGDTVDHDATAGERIRGSKALKITEKLKTSILT